MPRDYYLVLGVPNCATADEVHAAFRRRSKELHPDISGTGSAPFLELQEAHAVLGDPSRRRDYDRATGSRAHVHAARATVAEPVVPLRANRPDVVLRPRAAAEQSRPRREFSLMHDFQGFQPSFGELFDRLWRNFGAFTRPKGERVESLNVEIVATREEALRGGRVRIGIPARVTCSACYGRGNIAGFACWRCGGSGLLVAEQWVDVDYPAGLRDGYVAAVPLNTFAIENFHLSVVFRVGGEEAT